MATHSGQRSQHPTPHRRQQARQEGQVAVSQDFGSAVVLLAGLSAVLMLGSRVVDFFGRFTAHQLGAVPGLDADLPLFVGQSHELISQLARVVLPIMGVILIAAIGSSLIQVGFLFVPKRLAPDLTRLDPIKGLSRMFYASSAARLGFGIFKIVIIAVVAAMGLYRRREVLLSLLGMALPEIGTILVEYMLWISLEIGVALLILALGDLAFQRWKHERDLRMTHQEVREEMRNLQGDPQVLARRRAVQRQLVLNRLSQSVPKADVVVTNPTELAVAIQYDAATMLAPIIVAKGAGAMAQRIRRLALENDIPIVEKKPLAQALYRDVDVNAPIPGDQYAAVAEVLAYVYQLKGKQLPTPPQAA